MDKVSGTTIFFMTFLILIWQLGGSPIQENPLLLGAAAFITIPLGILKSVGGGSLLLMAVAFYALRRYFGLLEGFMTEPVYAFIVVAATILVLTGSLSF